MNFVEYDYISNDGKQIFWNETQLPQQYPYQARTGLIFKTQGPAEWGGVPVKYTPPPPDGVDGITHRVRKHTVYEADKEWSVFVNGREFIAFFEGDDYRGIGGWHINEDSVAAWAAHYYVLGVLGVLA